MVPRIFEPIPSLRAWLHQCTVLDPVGGGSDLGPDDVQAVRVLLQNHLRLVAPGLPKERVS